MRINMKGTGMKHLFIKLGAAICVMALCLGVVSGCANGAANVDSAQQAHRTYMSKVNGIMAQLGDDLDSFVDAVSRDDLVNMRTQADNAYRSLDELSKLEPPEDLQDVQKQYVDGTAKLREALDGYIELYTATDSSDFDQSTYASRLANVQKLYDEGVDLLKKADEAAASK